MKKEEIEIWKQITDFENYEVSNLGRIRRIECIITYSNGNTCNYKEKYLKLELTRDNYNRVTICKNNITKRFQVHRLIALYFIDNLNSSPCVNHKDGNKQNNKVSNLEWCTYSENENHSYSILGKINHNRKLSEQDINYIKQNAKKGVNNYKRGNLKQLSEQFCVNRTTITNLLNKQTYVDS